MVLYHIHPATKSVSNDLSGHWCVDKVMALAYNRIHFGSADLKKETRQ